MNDYEIKQEARRERLKKAAAKARAEAEALAASAARDADTIPLGQPILVGHHSEKRDRRYRERIARKFRRANERDIEARELASRAASVGTGGISSDDPDAAAKLREKLEELKGLREVRKGINASFRKLRKSGLDNAAAFARIAEALAPEHRRHVIDGARTMVACPWERVPFPPYSFSNLGARIRDAERRCATLAALDPVRASITGTVPFRSPFAPERDVVYEIVDAGPAENRVRVRFDGRYPAETLRVMRSRGFVWSRSANAFQRKRSAAAWWAATRAIVDMGGVLPADGPAASDFEAAEGAADSVEGLE